MDWKTKIAKIKQNKLKIDKVGKLSINNPRKRIVDVGPSNQDSALQFIVKTSNSLFYFKPILTILKILGVILLIVVFLYLTRNYYYQAFQQKNFTEIISSISSLAITFLTLGLLIVTGRYVKLTSHILQEMRDARILQSEPQVSIYIWPWLKDKEHLEQVYDYLSKVVIRNVGPVQIIDPSLHFEYFPDSGSQSITSGQSIGESNDKSGVVNPGEEITLLWGCQKESIKAYFKSDKKNKPFVILRLRYRDSYAQHYSITQDYDLLGNQEKPNLSMQCEFVSSPSCYRWRISPNGPDIWVTA